MKRWPSRLKLIWLSIAAVVLLVSLGVFTPNPQSEVTGTLIFCMFILAFPASWAAYAATMLLADHFGPIYHTRLLLTAAWALFVLVGYLQWFVVVPALFRILRRLRGHDVT